MASTHLGQQQSRLGVIQTLLLHLLRNVILKIGTLFTGSVSALEHQI